MKSEKFLKLTALFLCIILLLFMISACKKEKPEVKPEPRPEDYEYTLKADDKIEITRYIGNESKIAIPEAIDGFTVTSIADEAFLRDISSAYENKSLISVTIPYSIISIGRYAFAGCDNLTTINVDNYNPVYSSKDGVLFAKDKDKTTLVYYPDKKSVSYSIPNSVTHIGDSSFAGSINLASITIPNSVTDIEFYAFGGCTGLSSLTIPKSVKYIGFIAFKDCIGLTSLTIPGNVETIDVSAFLECTGLIDVIIEDGVKNINGGAFSFCTNLTSVIIPDSVIHIGDSADDPLGHAADAFWDCPNLTIMCSDGSYAHQYCLANNIKFILK